MGLKTGSGNSRMRPKYHSDSSVLNPSFHAVLPVSGLDVLLGWSIDIPGLKNRNRVSRRDAVVHHFFSGMRSKEDGARRGAGSNGFYSRGRSHSRDHVGNMPTGFSFRQRLQASGLKRRGAHTLESRCPRSIAPRGSDILFSAPANARGLHAAR